MRTEHVLHPTDFNQPPVKTTRDIVHCGPFRTTKQITTPTVVQKKRHPCPALEPLRPVRRRLRLVHRLLRHDARCRVAVLPADDEVLARRCAGTAKDCLRNYAKNIIRRACQTNNA